MDPQAVIDVFRRNVTEHYFDLKGRVSRKEFWYFVLASFVVYIGAAIIDAVLRTGLLTLAVSLALLLPTTGLGARRLQDTGRNGQLVWLWMFGWFVARILGLIALMSSPYGAMDAWYLAFTTGWLISLVNLAAFAISVVLIYFWIQPGTAGPNEYGPDPLAGAAAPA